MEPLDLRQNRRHFFLPLPVEGLYLSGAGCHGGPGVTFIPGYNAGYDALDAINAGR